MTAPAASRRERQHVPPTVAYGSEAYKEVIAALPTVLDRGRGYCLVFAGPNDARKKQGVLDVMDRAALNVHRFKTPQLTRSRYAETQGNLREAFDKASERAALLCFDDAEILFAALAGEEASQDALTPADYFFQRVNAFSGVVLLCLDSTAGLTRTPGASVDVVVEF